PSITAHTASAASRLADAMAHEWSVTGMAGVTLNADTIAADILTCAAATITAAAAMPTLIAVTTTAGAHITATFRPCTTVRPTTAGLIIRGQLLLLTAGVGAAPPGTDTMAATLLRL